MTRESGEVRGEPPAATPRGLDDVAADYRSAEVAVEMPPWSLVLAGLAIVCVLAGALFPLVGQGVVETSRLGVLTTTSGGVFGAGVFGVLLGQRRVLRRWRASLAAAGHEAAERRS